MQSIKYLAMYYGDETFTRVDSTPITTDIMNAEGCVWADFDNDGDEDRKNAPIAACGLALTGGTQV